jgi:hypothetical protein
MANDLNPSESDSADWNAALAAVNRLAGARNAVRSLHVEAGTDNPKTDKTKDAPNGDALAQAHLEIEKAAAALKTVQPDLRTWTDHHNHDTPRRTRRGPVWFLIALIWVGMVAVIISAIQAVKTLM